MKKIPPVKIKNPLLKDKLNNLGKIKKLIPEITKSDGKTKEKKSLRKKNF